MLTMRMSPRAVGDTHGTCVLGGPGPLSGSLGGSGVIRISRAGRLFLAIYALGTIAPPRSNCDRCIVSPQAPPLTTSAKRECFKAHHFSERCLPNG
jgi:hypothetical protein